MAASDSTRIPPTQPLPRIYRGDAVISLMEMIERYIPTARPLMSLAELRTEQWAPLSVDEVLDRISRRTREEGQ
jgi:hypothetical protein